MPMISANVAQPRDVVHGDAVLVTGIFNSPMPGAAAVRRLDPDSDSPTGRRREVSARGLNRPRCSTPLQPLARYA